MNFNKLVVSALAVAALSVSSVLLADRNDPDCWWLNDYLSAGYKGKGDCDAENNGCWEGYIGAGYKYTDFKISKELVAQINNNTKAMLFYNTLPQALERRHATQVFVGFTFNSYLGAEIGYTYFCTKAFRGQTVPGPAEQTRFRVYRGEYQLSALDVDLMGSYPISSCGGCFSLLAFVGYSTYFSKLTQVVQNFQCDGNVLEQQNILEANESHTVFVPRIALGAEYVFGKNCCLNNLGFRVKIGYEWTSSFENINIFTQEARKDLPTDQQPLLVEVKPYKDAVIASLSIFYAFCC